MTRLILFSRLRHDQRGATLVEVLVALSILAATVTVLGGRLPLWFRNDDLDRAAGAIRQVADRARLEARGQYQPVFMVIEQHRISLRPVVKGMAGPEILSRNLPRTLSFSMISALEMHVQGSPAVLFLPDGRTSGSNITLTASGRSQMIQINDQTALATRITQ